jgi:sulfur carrier protein ThiS
MSLFAKLFHYFTNPDTTITTEFNGEATVKIKYSVADEREVKVGDATTVKQLIEAQAKLANIDTSREYVVLCNGVVVDVNSKPVNGAKYSLSFSAGVAG